MYICHNFLGIFKSPYGGHYYTKDFYNFGNKFKLMGKYRQSGFEPGERSLSFIELYYHFSNNHRGIERLVLAIYRTE